jgi:hypothetical protein
MLGIPKASDEAEPRSRFNHRIDRHCLVGLIKHEIRHVRLSLFGFAEIIRVDAGDDVVDDFLDLLFDRKAWATANRWDHSESTGACGSPLCRRLGCRRERCAGEAVS